MSSFVKPSIPLVCSTVFSPEQAFLNLTLPSRRSIFIVTAVDLTRGRAGLIFSRRNWIHPTLVDDE